MNKEFSVKQTFNNLPEQKRQRVIQSSIAEFGEHGYEHGSTDRIVKRAGISKGGLYEYIESKKDLFLFSVDYTYTRLYEFIGDHISSKQIVLPSDILERFRLIASIAIEFYIQHPEMISFIVKCNHLKDTVLMSEVQKIFLDKFDELFSGAESAPLAFPLKEVIELLRWLLVKTRNDFVARLAVNSDTEGVRREYMNEWNLYLSMLSRGIYKEKKL
ncbi:Transcriptional regulator, TetR family [Chitinispirillum alkaliphilum]|nr:Transcriptional regulator, TetR family [Chitinispirillum alkaliphilum]